MKNVWWRSTMLALVSLLWIAPTLAKADDRDPPIRVARMNYSEGSVSFQPGGEGDWLTAGRNRPITSGDNVWTDRDSRAELHVGSTVLRLAPETSVSFLDLDDRETQVRLAQGSLMLRVRHLDDDDNFEVDTPNLAFALVRTGEYRVEVDPDGETTVVTVWQGQGEATGGGYSYRVLAGQRARFSGDNELDHEIGRIPDYDGFENWAFDRDRREDRFDSENYISPEMTGYEDLDDYGSWRYVGDYGNVWVPSGVPEGWAPYRYGHWDWIQPWGWTWVEDEPWGFAPFHYGRWAYAGNSWCWVPGPVVVRPVYAPALVAFVGGEGFALGGGPAVGWFPLAPGEVFVPGYRVSRTYVQQVNVTNTVVNVTRVTNVYNTTINDRGGNTTRITYVNQRAPNAVTAVSRDTFVNARPVAKAVMPVNPRQVESAPVVHTVEVQPARASVLGAGAPAKARPPATVENRQVIANRAPMPVRGPLGQSPAQSQVKVESAKPPAPDQGPRGEQTRAGAPVQDRAQPPRTSEPPQAARNVPRPPNADRNEEPAPAPRTEQPRAAEPRDNQPAEPRNVPRPPDAGRNEPGRAAEPAREPERTEPQRAPENQQPWSHPLAKPAPPQREPNPAQAQQEEQKQSEWRRQRESAPPQRENAPPPQQQREAAPAPRPAPAPAQPPKPPGPQGPQPPRNGPPQR